MKERRLERILFVDDDKDIQLIGKLGLERVGGFTVQVCSSGVEALEDLLEFKPDMVLLDVMMPGMDGLTTLEAIHRLPGYEDLPVVFVTAKAQRAEMQRYLERGALGVIKKPFDPVGLGERLEQLWAAWQTGSARRLEALEIEDLRIRYRESLRDRLQRVEELLEQAVGDHDRGTLQEAAGMIHNLGGSGAMFGFPEVSRVCQSGEVVLQELLKSEKPLEREELEKLRGACEGLKKQLEEV